MGWLERRIAAKVDCERGLDDCDKEAERLGSRSGREPLGCRMNVSNVTSRNSVC